MQGRERIFWLKHEEPGEQCTVVFALIATELVVVGACERVEVSRTLL
jgi:hypothetical protein